MSKIERLVLVTDWSHPAELVHAARLMLAVLPLEDAHPVKIVVHGGSRAKDAVRTREFALALGNDALRIAALTVEPLATFALTKDDHVVQVGTLDETVASLCGALAKIAASHPKERNIIEVVHSL